MRILIIYHAGAALSARRIYQALAETCEMELTVGVPEKVSVDRVYDPSGWLCVKREEEEHGYRLVPVPLQNPSNYWQGFESKHLAHLIKKTQPEIIHVLNEPLSPGLFQVVWQKLKLSKGSKVLFYGFDNLPIRFFLGRVSYMKWKFVWAQTAGGVTANTEALENLKRAGFPGKRPLERIFWGVPTDIFKPMDKSLLRKSIGLDCEFIVGFVGRLVPEKGLFVLLAAMLRLPTAVHCMIIGSGPMRAELELMCRLPELNGRIHLYDAVEAETLAKYINCTDALAIPSLTMPSWKEQYGRVIGEAMACGVPVVGSDSGAIPEVIGSAGLIVPEGNTVALGEAIKRAIFDQEVRAHFIQQGLERAQQELSVKAMTRQLVGFYNRILCA